jgi:hypothetical protein
MRRRAGERDIRELVIAGLDPAIHHAKGFQQMMDARIKSAHDAGVDISQERR